MGAEDLTDAFTHAAARGIGDRGRRVPMSAAFVAHFVQKWLHEPGFPLVTIRTDPKRGPGWLRITQERYLATGRPRIGASKDNKRQTTHTGSLWPIYLNLSHGASSNSGLRSEAYW